MYGNDAVRQLNPGNLSVRQFRISIRKYPNLSAATTDDAKTSIKILLGLICVITGWMNVANHHYFNNPVGIKFINKDKESFKNGKTVGSNSRIFNGMCINRERHIFYKE